MDVYAAPYSEIVTEIGTFDRRISAAEVDSGRLNPSAIATVVLDNRHLDFVGMFRPGMSIKVNLGYRELGAWRVFTGYVVDVSGDKNLTLYCKDLMRDCHSTFVTKAFVDVRPIEVVSYCLQEARVSRKDVGGDDLPKRRHFVLRRQNVTQAIRLVERTWGITGWDHHFTPGGVFTWKPWEPGPEVYVFETGKNIIAFKSYSELWQLETHLFPWMCHGQLVRVKDDRLGFENEDLFRVERTLHRFSEAPRMTLWLRRLSSIPGYDGGDSWGVFQEGR